MYNEYACTSNVEATACRIDYKAKWPLLCRFTEQ